uniref:Uncharacterized protein n=1 Tax=Oryza rufipogon TaxID=4529 RepID=A0A0E0MZR8_ORYRU
MPAIHDLYMLRQSSRAMQTSITEITARLAKVTELVLALRAGGDVGNYDDDALSAAHAVDSRGAVVTRDGATFSAIAPVRGYGGGTGDDDALFTAIGPIGGGATALSCSAIFSVVVCIRGGGSDVTPHSSPVSLGTINSTVAMEDYRVASSPFPSTTTAAARDLTTASFSGGCDYAERCSTTRSIACGANGVGSRQAMRAGKEGTAAAAQREQHARQSPGAPPPTRAAGGRCQYQIWRYLGPFHYWIRLSHVSDEAMDRTNPRGLHLGVMSSGRMLIDVNPPTLLGDEGETNEGARSEVSIDNQRGAADIGCSSTLCAGMLCVRHITMAQLVPTSTRHGTCGIMVDTYTGLVPAVSWLIPTGFRPGTCGIMVDVSGTN